jgi:hypothetical protein
MNRIICLLAVIVLLAGVAGAQDTRSTILGYVKDAQGGAVPNASVVVTNLDTNATVRVKSNESGYYEAALLIPGPYTVTIEAPGFKKAVRSGVTLQVTDRRDLSVTLEVGAVTDSVTVTAEAPLVDVSRTDSGRVIDDRSVRDLPAMANTVFTMIRYTAGVQSGGPSILLGPHSTQGGSDYNNGTGIGGNTWTIDGAINDGNSRYTANLPSVDAVAEVKVMTTTFEGSFGHSTGLGVAVMTKTGTNQFHGTASNTYWSQRWQGASFFAKQTYYKNIAALNAAGNTAGAAAAAAKPIQPSGHSNMWTLNATGPLAIPKLFNGKDKVFWTFSYNGEKDAKPEEASTYNRVVPTDLNRTGNFSDLLNVATNPAQFQLYDPYSTTPDTTRPGHYVRTPIAGNILPGQYIAMGKKFYDNYVKYWPSPNNWFDKTTTPSTNPYLSITAPYNWTFNPFSGRLDLNVGNNHRFFGRYSQNHFVEMRGDWTIDIMPGLNNTNAGGTGVTRDDQNGVLDWVWTVTPTTMFHAAASISNWDSASSVANTPFNYKPSDVGLPTYLDQKCGNWCYLPQMNISGYSTNGIGGYPAPTYNRFIGYNADLYHNRGNHSLRAGLDIRSQVRSAHAGNNDGQYTFGNNYFRRYDDAGTSGYSAGGIGLSWASFMMGMPTSMTISNNDSNIVSNPYYAWFVQDTWRVNKKLTLTLSLRSEYETGATERFNRYIVDYDKTAVLPISAAVEAAYAANAQPELAASLFKVTGGAIYASAPGARKRAWDNTMMWLPRIGVGYQLDKKTVLRGGYGIYYDTTNVNAVAFSPNQNYYSKSTNPTIYNNDTNQIPVFNPLYSTSGAFPTVSPLNDPFPVRSDGTRFDAPLRDMLGAMATVSSGWNYSSNALHARQQRGRISVERQIGPQDVIEVSYEGTYTSNMSYTKPSAQGVPSTYYNFSQIRNDTNGNWLGTGVTNPFYGETTSGTVPSDAKAIYPASVINNATLWTWMSTNSLFTSKTRTRSTMLFSTPNGNVGVPEPRFHSRSSMFTINYNRRFSRGLTANVAYTFMRNISGNGYFQGWSPDDPTLPQSPYWNPVSPYGRRLTATFVYDLPFGKGRQFVQNKYLDLAVGGWTLSGAIQVTQGGLLGFGSNYYYGSQDPNSLASSLILANPTPSQYFNTAGCVATTALSPGDTIVGATGACTSGFEKRSSMAASSYQYRTFPNNIPGLRAPGVHQIDGSLTREFRMTKIREGMGFVIRMDMINVENNSILNGPTTTPTSSTFGQITGASASPNRFIQLQGRLRW